MVAQTTMRTCAVNYFKKVFKYLPSEENRLDGINFDFEELGPFIVFFSVMDPDQGRTQGVWGWSSE